jgi:hypothetical protein
VLSLDDASGLFGIRNGVYRPYLGMIFVLQRGR